MTTEENLKHIKQSFRLLMNGVTAQSLRDKGLEYHLNWGANLLHLKEMAEPYGKDYDLAITLWKEDIRECKILATLLAEIQRIKSEGDLEAARNIVETYGVKLNPELHKEILDRYEHLNIAPYKGFLNPKLTLVKDGDTIKDVAVSYDETLDEQMLRYSGEYSIKSKG